MRVTAEKLVDAGAVMSCGKLRWFKKRWPNGCNVTLKNLEAVAKKDMYLLCWFAGNYLDDHKFSVDLGTTEANLLQAWDDTVGKRYINDAKNCGRLFILCLRSQKRVIEYLRVYKRSYESARSVARVLISHKLARMVYDKIKSGAGKKRRAK